MIDEEVDRLYRLIDKGTNHVMETYLKGGGNPNLRNRNGWTLLMVAAFKGRTEIARRLLHYGAEIDATNSVGETALALAVNKGRVRVLTLLLAHGSSTKFRPLGMPLMNYLNHGQNKSEKVRNLLREAIEGTSVDDH